MAARISKIEKSANADLLPVTYFRLRRKGPEAVIEDAVAEKLPSLVRNRRRRCWTAGSLPIGAGMPDLTVLTYEPEVYALASVNIPTTDILGYLRAVGKAHLDAIVQNIGRPPELVRMWLHQLIEADIIRSKPSTFEVAPIWRTILPEIITIEAKVTNWKKAVSQANRNRIFAHRSYIALPESVANRVKDEPIFQERGIGILSVADDHSVLRLREAHQTQPRVWGYYYYLATIVAQHLSGSDHAVSSTNRTSESRLS